MGPGDREFLIHPSFGAAVKTALQPSAVSEAASRTLAKKPFDWLLDEQYSYLQVRLVCVSPSLELLLSLMCQCMLSNLHGEYSNTAINECHVSSFVTGKLKSAYEPTGSPGQRLSWFQ